MNVLIKLSQNGEQTILRIKFDDYLVDNHLVKTKNICKILL